VRVLGVDPGTLVTGYGVIEEAKGAFRAIAGGDIKMDSALELPERLLKIFDTLVSVIDEHKPDCLSLESAFFAKNARSALFIGHARGVVMLSAARFGIKVFEYPPSTVKQAVTGSGGATKEQVEKMVRLLTGVDKKMRPDVYDAYAAAICHINHSAVAALGPIRRGRGGRRR